MQLRFIIIAKYAICVEKDQLIAIVLIKEELDARFLEFPFAPTLELERPLLVSLVYFQIVYLLLVPDQLAAEDEPELVLIVRHINIKDLVVIISAILVLHFYVNVILAIEIFDIIDT